MSAAGDTRYTRPDMEVVGSLLHGSSRPYTSQSQGCGVAGDLTSIPLQFVLDYRKKGYHHKLLAHEFFKLRFGIFDEVGYPGDPIYPHYYVDNNSTRLKIAVVAPLEASTKPTSSKPLL